MQSIDIIGKRFGKLKVLAKTDEKIAYSDGRKYKVKCDCGTVKNINPYMLTRTKAAVKSCGCTKRMSYVEHLGKHCKNEYNRFKYLQSLGNVVKRWDIHKGGSFENFIKDLGEKPFPEARLLRLNRREPYGPKNCRWGTLEEQRKIAYQYMEYNREYNSSGYSGVTFDYTNAAYMARFINKDGKHSLKRFSASKYNGDYDAALDAAAKHVAKARSETTGKKVTVSDLVI